MDELAEVGALADALTTLVPSLERFLTLAVPETPRVILPTERPDVVLRELSKGDIDPYFQLVDRNRNHLNQRGDYGFEAVATSEDVASYFENPWDDNVRLGIWCDEELVGRVDLVPVSLGFEQMQDVENRSRWRFVLTDSAPPPVMA